MILEEDFSVPPKRADIKPGSRVRIVLKKDQRTGALTEGVVQDILTKSHNHPHGIKVRLTSGDVGRVQAIWEPCKPNLQESPPRNRTPSP